MTGSSATAIRPTRHAYKAARALESLAILGAVIYPDECEGHEEGGE